MPIVLMTAWSSVKLAVEAMRGGGRDFIEKPWDNNKLLETIRRNLGTAGSYPADQPGSALRSEVQEAREIQRRLLPLDLPGSKGYEIHGSCVLIDAGQPGRGLPPCEPGGSGQHVAGKVRDLCPWDPRHDWRYVSVHSQEHLDMIARKLTGRPRETLEFANPAETLNARVASTG